MAEGPAEDPNNGRLRSTILVIDDEIGIRKGCQRVLAAEGHDVILAQSAEEGLEILRQGRQVDLALVDLRMEGMGGLDFLVEATKISPELVCVVITAYATLDTAIESTRRGAYDFLAKPFSPEELLRVVNKALDRVSLIRERNRLQAEREQRMLELSTEKSRLRNIINSMADGVLVCNAEQQLVLFNPAALRVLPGIKRGAESYPLAEVLQPPELNDVIEEASRRRVRLSQEIRLTHLPTQAWVLADVSPVCDDTSGLFLGTVTVLRDITELKRVEEVKAQFVNMIAHELRAPLAAVDGFLSVLSEGLVKDPEQEKHMLQRCRERIRALAELVSDLLDMARMEAGRVRREIMPQKLSDIISVVVELMAPVAQQHGVTLTTQVSDDLRSVDADREELIRLFNNLVSNAIKYNRPGGTVTITAAEDGAYVKVAVADTGVGISEEGLKRLFTEFFREKRPETREISGTGLGLSIVKRIVDFYHGRLDVQSKIGEGSTFTVWLPFSTSVPSSVSAATGESREGQ